MGLVKKVVPPAELEKEVNAWCREILEKAAYNLVYIKASFNADTDHVNGIGVMAKNAMDL
jgi:1,4-dihydroxy-2-naphthoyl-CoA synthase